MKKFLLKAIAILVIIIVSIIIGVWLGDKLSIPIFGFINPNFKLTMADEAERMKNMGIVLTEEGDAAEVYKDFIGPDFETRAPVQDEEWYKKFSSKENYDLMDALREDDFDTVVVALEDPGVQEIFNTAGPSLDDLIAASRKKELTIYPDIVKFKPSENIFTQGVLAEHRPMQVTQNLLILRGIQSEVAGDDEAAREHYLTLVRMGAQFTDNALFVRDFIFGSAFKKRGSIALARHYRRKGLDGDAMAWENYASVTDARKSYLMDRNYLLALEDEAYILNVLKDKDTPICFRLELVAIRHYCLPSMGGLMKCKIVGYSDEIKLLEDALANESPEAKLFIEQLRAVDIPLEELTQTG
jgi:hypothetical protein